MQDIRGIRYSESEKMPQGCSWQNPRLISEFCVFFLIAWWLGVAATLLAFFDNLETKLIYDSA